jgi:4-hydroxythreonine-4-phosphate dehydrogenase
MPPATAAPIVLTMGEPAGVGGEIALKAWLRRREGLPGFVVIDDPARLRALAQTLGLEAPIAEVAQPADASAAFDRAVPVLRLPLAADVRPGQPQSANAPAVLESIRRAVDLALAGRARAVVTNPIHKRVLHDAAFRHPGHTEYLAELAGVPHPVMMLVGGGIRVVPVTTHMSLRDSIAALDTALIVEIATVTAQALTQDFAIARPRLAVAGLNPHAGEGGDFGREEIDIIRPAVEALARAGVDAAGPLPADSLFHAGIRDRFDAVLCMYHDQALIPLKTLDFERGVNVTLGLPFVRTSPDHGTAFDIAGTGRASAESLIAALHLADALAANRARRHQPESVS